MQAHPLTGIFASLANAQHALDALVAAGVSRERITIGDPETADGIAAEAPGQSYENQVGEDRHSVERGEFGEAVRGAVCTLSVDTESEDDRRRVGDLLRAGGAREVVQPPA